MCKPSQAQQHEPSTPIQPRITQSQPQSQSKFIDVAILTVSIYTPSNSSSPGRNMGKETRPRPKSCWKMRDPDYGLAATTMHCSNPYDLDTETWLLFKALQHDLIRCA